ncbi:hypothetical protein OC861_006742 [Tilletia horrida]|nr:hypothetical protein OC845_006666 [Tilletia horrida]KAK0559112.1 hypothetical protein OC861_006742 [Tilletia horrida]
MPSHSDRFGDQDSQKHTGQSTDTAGSTSGLYPPLDKLPSLGNILKRKLKYARYQLDFIRDVQAGPFYCASQDKLFPPANKAGNLERYRLLQPVIQPVSIPVPGVDSSQAWTEQPWHRTALERTVIIRLAPLQIKHGKPEAHPLLLKEWKVLRKVRVPPWVGDTDWGIFNAILDMIGFQEPLFEGSNSLPSVPRPEPDERRPAHHLASELVYSAPT